MSNQEEPLYETDTDTETETEIDIPKPTGEEVDDLRAQLAEFVNIDDQLRKLSIAVRERRTRQRALGMAIETFMKTYKYDLLNSSAGAQIKSTKRKVKAPLKLADVRKKLMELKGEDEGGQLVNQIFDNRPLLEKTGIRRIVPKFNKAGLDL